jgi:hypothetical protein
MKWKYKVATFSLRRSDQPREGRILEMERCLDELGSDGWELVSLHTGDESERPWHDEIVAIFKRPSD